MAREQRTTSRSITLAAAAAVALAVSGAPIPAAGEQDAAGGAADQQARVAAARQYFGNVELVAQDGRTLHLYDDLMQDRVVVVSVFFATCEGVCPALNGKLAAVQSWLGERLGREVNMISVTVDPEHDTPEVLADYARRWKARPGWYFLTGEPANVKLALQRFGQFVEEKEAHSPIVLIGNEKTGLWKKANGLASPEALIAIIDSVIRDEG